MAVLHFTELFWGPIHLFNSATFFVSVPSQEVDFQSHMWWYFVFGGLW
jgi:hypothetical protein